MSTPNFRVHTAPIRDEASQAYRVRPFGAQYPGAFDTGFGQSLGLTLKDPFQFGPDTPNYVENPLISGRSRIATFNLPRRNLVIRPGEMDAAEWSQLNAILSTGRPVAVGAWYDDSTVWMSHFAGVDDVWGGLAEVGRCNAGQIQRRDAAQSGAGDYWPHPIAGWNNLVSGKIFANGNPVPKIVAGDVGRAIALADSTYQFLAAYTPGSGAPLFPNASTHAYRSTSPSIEGPGFLGGWADHILLRWVTGSTVYVETADIVYPTFSQDAGGATAVLLARGSGNIRIINTLGAEVALYTLTDEIQPLYLYFGASNTTSRIRIQADGTNVTMTAHGLSVHPGRIPPVSWPTNTGGFDSPQVPDAVLIDDVVPSDQWTLVTWVKYFRSDTEKMLFASASLGQRYEIFVRGEDLSFEQDDGSTYTVADVFSGLDGEAGEWCQIAVTFGPSLTIDSTHEYRYYVNGVLRATQTSNQNLFPLIPSSTFGFWIGKSQAQLWYSCALPISRWRLDSRRWSTAEVLQDYTNWTDPGMKAFLEKVTGRYFMPAHSMGAIGPYIDRMTGEITLRQVDIRPQSAT